MSPNPYTKIIVRDLILNMSIGIHDHEKAAAQRVVVNMEISSVAVAEDDITQTVNYEDVVNGVEKLASSKHYDLVESFAEDIAALCLEHPKSSNVKVRVEKPDIIAQVKSVGVEILRFSS